MRRPMIVISDSVMVTTGSAMTITELRTVIRRALTTFGGSMMTIRCSPTILRGSLLNAKRAETSSLGSQTKMRCSRLNVRSSDTNHTRPIASIRCPTTNTTRPSHHKAAKKRSPTEATRLERSTSLVNREGDNDRPHPSAASRSTNRAVHAHRPGRGKLYAPELQPAIVDFAQWRRGEGAVRSTQKPRTSWPVALFLSAGLLLPARSLLRALGHQPLRREFRILGPVRH